MRRWLIALPLLAAGCSRAYWRTAADADAYPILAERIARPEYAIGDPVVTPPAASRLHDPFDPDKPPQPPDDPVAATFMAYPNGIRGARNWGRDGVTPDVELNPAWLGCLPRTDKGAVRLSKDTSFDLALTHSRDYQTAREAVYAPALNLSLNRFEFDLQWAGSLNPIYTRTGNGGPPFETNTLNATDGRLGFSRNLYAGGQLLVNFANSFVWEYTGSGERVVSTFSGSLVQPLLRGFGRDIRLEGLVQAERDVLYAVRSYARFRKRIWADVTTNPGGYLGLLLAVQQVRNARFALRIAEEDFRIAEAEFRGGKRSPVDYDLTLQRTLASRLNVINAETSLQNSLDQFKLTLGLPPTLPVELDDSPLDRFVLIDPKLEKLQDDASEFLLARQKELGEPPPVPGLLAAADALAALFPKAATAIDDAEADVGRWEKQLSAAAPADADPQMRKAAADEYARVKADPPRLREELKRLTAGVAAIKANAAPPTRLAAWEALVAAGRQFQDLLTAAAAAQTKARIYLIRLPAVDADEAAAIAQAKRDRLDLQNALGAVTDEWRRVRVTANRLQSDLNVVVGGDLGTTADARNPLEFNANNSVLRAGLRFDGPLNRRAERNAYRLQLIAYHRARRDYMLQSDLIEQQIRLDLRTLAQLRANFEIGRQQLISSARQLQTLRRQLNAPVAQEGGRGGSGGTSSTLALLNAQQALLDNRNQLAAAFISYEQQRIRLLLDLEALQLDARGVPTNDAATDRPDPPAAAGPPAAGPPPP
jgi:outer membrane protein TolC